MKRRKRLYDGQDYFNFLYDLAFDTENYVSLARYLHKMPYRWNLRMDENRVWDGIEMRKYYLADDLGYMPDEFDVDDEYIFPTEVSVFEVLVGLAYKVCRDMTSEFVTCELVEMFLKNLKILFENWGFGENEIFVENSIKKWEMGKKNIWGFGENEVEGVDLWSQGSIWLSER